MNLPSNGKRARLAHVSQLPPGRMSNYYCMSNEVLSKSVFGWLRRQAIVSVLNGYISIFTGTNRMRVISTVTCVANVSAANAMLPITPVVSFLTEMF